MDLKERIQELCKKKKVSMNKVETDLGFGKGYISKLGKSTPNIAKIRQIAEYFQVSVNDLICDQEPPASGSTILSSRDERDIAKELSDILKELDSNDGLMFDSDAFDDETRDYLKSSLELALKNAKIMAKEKFTPKKYRKKGE